MQSENRKAESQNTYQPMVEIDFPTGDFYSFWPNCDLISTYLARMISHNRSDLVRYTNLFSSAANELLEVVFRTQHSEGRFTCSVSRWGDFERVRIAFPCSQEEHRYYEEAIRQAAARNTLERYVASLTGEDGPGRDTVLLELALDYGAALHLERPDDHTVAIIVDLPLESLP